MLKTGYVLSNRYQIVKPLGQGGQSNVYLLKDLRLKGKRWVAKEMTAQYANPRDQALAKKHFEMEANILATLEHAHLPKVIDYFSQGGKHYLIMQYLEGEDLGKQLRRATKPFTEEQVVNWAMQVATVLYYLHCQKPPIIFRDIKPSNIIVLGGQVKLIDFGIARHFNPAKKGDTLRIGSPGYSPPEQYSGQTDQRSDIYSLGVTMHHLLTLQDPSKTQTPFQLPPIRVYNQNVSSALISIIEKCIQIEQSKRYDNALDLKKDLKNLTSSGKTTMVASPGVTAPYNPTGQTVLTPPPPAGQTILTPPPQVGQTVLTPPPTQENGNAGSYPETSQAGILTVPTPPPDPKAGVPQQMQSLQPGGANIPAAAKPPQKVGIIGKIAGALITLIIIAGLLTGGYFLATKTDLLSKYIGKQPIPAASPSEEPGNPLELGLKAYQEGDYRNAVLQLIKARQKNPDDVEALEALNNTYIAVSEAPKIALGVLLPAEDKDGRNQQKIRNFLAGVLLTGRNINFNGGINGSQLSIEIIRLSGDKTKDGEMINGLMDKNPIAVISPEGGSIIDQAAEMTSKKGIALLAPGIPGVEKEAGNLITWGVSPEKQMGALARLLSTDSRKKIYLVYEAKSFDNYVSILEKELNKVNIKIVKLISYQSDALNFDLGADEKKVLKPDAIVILGNESGAAYFVNTLRKNNFDTEVYLSPGLTRESFLAQCGENSSKLTGLSLFYKDTPNYRAAYFVSLFRETYSKEPLQESATGYDLSNLAVYAAGKSFSEPEKTLTFLNSLRTATAYNGVTGNYGGKSDNSGQWWAKVESIDGKWQEKGGFRY